MKEKKIAFENARNFSIMDTLKRSGHIPKKLSEKEAWFISPFRNESHASFKVSLVLRLWCFQGRYYEIYLARINSLESCPPSHLSL